MDVQNGKKINLNTKKNLEYFRKEKNIQSAKDMADIIGISESQYSRVMSEKEIYNLSLSALLNVRNYFECSIDEFLFSDIEIMENTKKLNRKEISDEKYKKYCGLYQMYYYDSKVHKGRDYAGDAKALKCGIMLIYTDAEMQHKVIAVFDFKKEDADKQYQKFRDKLGKYGYHNTCSSFNNMGRDIYVYEGTIELLSNHFEIELKFANKDSVLMLFHRPVSPAPEYIGGLGAMVSVSKGRSASPCMQYIGISRESLLSSSEEIAQNLLMHYPAVKSYDSIDKLMNMIHEYYSQDEKSGMNDEEKKIMIRMHIDTIINRTIEKNLFRSVLVSETDDDEWYHYLKRVKKYH